MTHKPRNRPLLIFQETTAFPAPETAMLKPNGLLAVGGDLSLKRLLSAYQQGIFPWFSEGDPICWWSPNPRMVLFPDELKISRSLRKYLKQEHFSFSYNQDFSAVIRSCALPRHNETETWITQDMINAYIQLHQAGYAHSVEVWQNNQLVGGLYGVGYCPIFSGESMFSLVSNASKAALVYLVNTIKEQGYQLIDCQMHTPHLASMGAREIDRKIFLNYLREV
jgi:leucyl/phenylalanyl-tRNA--protein transferase